MLDGFQENVQSFNLSLAKSKHYNGLIQVRWRQSCPCT